MEQQLRIDSLEWFEKSKSSVSLLKEFFDARLQIEKKVESIWTTFYTKWQKKFEEVEDPLKLTSTEESLSDKMRLLVEETRDNSIICCSVKSLLQRKRQNPSTVLKRWLTNPMEDTGCVNVEEFKDYYITAVNNMAAYEKKADKSLQALHEKITGLQKVVAEWSLVPMSDLNRHIALAKKEEEKQREVDRAKDSYHYAVCLHKQARPPYLERMSHLEKCLDSYEKNRLAAMQQATKLYLGAINQYETQRASRKQRVEELLVYFNSIEVNKTVEQCLSSLKEPCNFPEYLDVHEVLASNNQVSRKIEVQPQRHSPPELHKDSGHEQVSTPEQEDVKLPEEQQVADNVTPRSLKVRRIEVAPCKKSERLSLHKPIFDATSIRKTLRSKHSFGWQSDTPQEQQRDASTSVERPSTLRKRGYLDNAKGVQGEPYWEQSKYGVFAKEFWRSMTQLSNLSVEVELQEQEQNSPESIPKDAGTEENLSPDSQIAMEIEDLEDVTEDIELDGKSINTDKMFKSSIEEVNGATTPVEPGPSIQTPVPLLKETQAFKKEDDQPEIVKMESDIIQDVGVMDVATAAHIKVYAMDSYESLLPGHLTFHTGQKIKQKRAANEDGLAFGYIMTNKFTRYRAYGLYPVRLVALKVPSKKRSIKNFFRKK